jgi:hypothetical protein
MFHFFDDNPDTATHDRPPAPGKVRFDERGNAIYDWGDDKLQQDGKQAEQLRERALIDPTLKLVEEDCDGNALDIRNDKGLMRGYNPYQSGQLGGKQTVKKRDMRELSKWIEMQRRMGLLPSAATIKK